MPLPETLAFKTEDERIALMESHAKDPGASPDDFNRIMSAPVEVPDPVVPEVVEGDVFAGSDGGPAPATAPSPAPAPAPAPASGSAAPPPAPAAEKPLNRNWTIREEDIPKDTYYDQKTGKVRPYITHTDPKDLLKTVVHEQKRIHYLEDVLIPQEREAAAQQARAAVLADLEKVKAELEQVKKVLPAPAAPGSPTQATAAAPAAMPQSSIGDSAKALQAAMDQLKGIDPKDAIEHTDKLMAALMASVAHSNNMTSHMSKIQEDTGKVSGQFQKIEQDRATETQRRDAEARQSEAQQNWQKAVLLVDSFAQTNKDFKEEYGSVDQSFGDMTRDAVSFHTQLAGLLFNKHPNQVSNEEQIAASQAFLKGEEKLVQAAQQYGINEPRNYRAWVELDQVDAMRTGMYRDPNTKQWVQMADPITKKPVHLGDMETSYGRYLDVSGKRQTKIQRMLKQQQDGLTNAITRRDKGVTSMDVNKLGAEGAGNELSEQQASEILEQIDPGRAQMQYIKTGNRDMLDRLNMAMVRVGMQPIEIPDIDSGRPVKR